MFRIRLAHSSFLFLSLPLSEHLYLGSFPALGKNVPWPLYSIIHSFWQILPQNLLFVSYILFFVTCSPILDLKSFPSPKGLGTTILKQNNKTKILKCDNLFSRSIIISIPKNQGLLMCNIQNRERLKDKSECILTKKRH